MKLRNLFHLLFIAFAIICLSTSCVKEGPLGPEGTDGTNGTDGAGSVHATGTAFARASSADCAPCHSAEGFINSVSNKTAVGISDPSHITCEACHDGMHITFDVANDGIDYALRTKAAVDVIIDPGKVIDLGSEANLCVNCHQSRTAYPEPDVDGNFAVTSSHYGPHHGPQGNLLVGTGGFEFSGSENYVSGNTSTTHAVAGCTTCHMNEGSHAFTPSIDACKTCHTSATDFDYHGKQAEIVELLAQLKTKLDAHGVITAVSSASSASPAVLPVVQARAFYNYTLIEEDRSEGVHNPKYIHALLQNTIEALN